MHCVQVQVLQLSEQLEHSQVACTHSVQEHSVLAQVAQGPSQPQVQVAHSS